jgi:hypothetical protein
VLRTAAFWTEFSVWEPLKAENPAKMGKNRRKYHKNHKKIGKTLLFALTLPMQMSQGNERRVLRPA